MQLLLVLVLGCVAAAQQSSSAVDKYVFDFSALYPNDAAWEAERQTIERGLTTVGRWQGDARKSAKNMADALDAVSDLRGRAAKMIVFGFLVEDLESQSAKRQSQFEVAASFEARVESAVAFIGEEVRGVGAAKLDEWIKMEPRLQRHRIRINRILAEGAHALPPEVQAVVESMGRWPRSSSDIFQELHESRAGWPQLADKDGKSIEINLGNYRSVPPELRREAARQFLTRLRDLEGVFGMLYTRRIEADLTIARHRKFDEGMETIWYLRDGMPRGSHKIMMQVARDRLNVIRRAARARSLAVGASKASYEDLYARSPQITGDFTIEKAIETALAISTPLGKDYQQRLRARLDQGWMHLPPREGKRGDLAIFPTVGGAHPYFITNYTGNHSSSRIFAGGTTLMMTYGDLPPNYQPDTRDDPPIYSNGILYVAYMMHDDYLRKQAATKEQEIALTVATLDMIRNQYTRWIVMAELDTRVQEMIIAGKTPAGSQISEMYLKLLREYYADGEGGVEVDAVFAAEWMLNGVPFLSYEHQFWPPSLAMATLIFERLQKGDEAAKRSINGVLGHAESDRSYPLLKSVGVDLATREPYEAAFRKMEELSAELERLVAAAKK